MKRLFGLVFLFVAINASAIEINSKLSGSWFNPSQNGHGLNVAIYDNDLTLIYWYVYHTDGTPMFLITVGSNVGNQTSGSTYYNAGMKFGEFDPIDNTESEWGTTTLTFTDCNNATLQYSAFDPEYGSGSIPMQRLTSIPGLKCSDSPLHGNYLGTYERSDLTGSGIAILFEDGYMVMSASSNSLQEVSLGEWWSTGSDTFACELTGYSSTGQSALGECSGSFGKDGIITTFTGDGFIGTGKMVGTILPSFEDALNKPEVAGNYDIYDGLDRYLGTANIMSDGKITASYAVGCDFAGTFGVPNTMYNQAIVEMDISNCGDSVKFSGAAIYLNENIFVYGTDMFTGLGWVLKPN